MTRVDGSVCTRCRERRWPTPPPAGVFVCQRCRDVLAGGNAVDPLEGSRSMMAATDEQTSAFKSLRALPGRFKVVADAEGWPIIPGRTGMIEYHDGDTLAVFTDRPRLFAKLWAIPGVRRHQGGDTEIRAVFDPAALPAVAVVIGARRKRSMSPGQARNLAVGTAILASRRLQDRRFTPDQAQQAAPEAGALIPAGGDAPHEGD